MVSILRNYKKPIGYKYYNWFFTQAGQYVIYSRDGKRFYINETKLSKKRVINMPFRTVTEARKYLDNL